MRIPKMEKPVYRETPLPEPANTKCVRQIGRIAEGTQLDFGPISSTFQLIYAHAIKKRCIIEAESALCCFAEQGSQCGAMSVPMAKEDLTGLWQSHAVQDCWDAFQAAYHTHGKEEA
jgi:hypothetical protein